MPRAATFHMLCVLVGIALAGCAPPPGADPLPPERLRDLVRPDLAPTAEFDAALAGTEPDAARLEEANAALAARAADLRARAADLSAPVVAPEERTRLEDAASRE